MKDHGLDLAVIGNGRTAALVDPCSRIVWWCYPRFDGDPIFCRLVSGHEEKGFSDVVLDDMVDFQSEYVRNTAIVTTVLTDTPWRQGPNYRFRRRGFASSGASFGRRSSIASSSRLPACRASSIRMRPTCEYGKPLPHRSLGSNHIRYSNDCNRDPSDDGRAAVADRQRSAVRAHPSAAFGVRIRTSLLPAICGSRVATSPSARTIIGWNGCAVCRSRSIGRKPSSAPPSRSSFPISTKPAASSPRTPLRFPEAPSSGRTWDYRYCWLRDAYFVVQALNRIGATRTMEEFISFTLSIASKPDQELRPLYSVVPTTSVEERIAPELAGYRGDGPVRIGNAAVDQVQNDTYGSVILAAMPMFFDRRLPRPGDEGLFHLLESLGSRAAKIGVRARRRHLGISRPPARPHPFGGDVLGRLSAARGDRGADRPRRARQILECDRRTDARRTHRARLERKNAARSPRRSAPTILMPVCSCSPTSVWSKSTIRALSPRSPPWSANWCAKSMSCATPAPTILACR